MIDAHYAGKIKVSDYWEIGDTTNVKLKGWDSYNFESKELDIVDTQPFNAELVIIGFDHDDLVTPINGITKAAITVQFKEPIFMGIISGADDRYVWGDRFNKASSSSSSYYSSIDYWLNSYHFLNAFHNITDHIKKVNKVSNKYSGSKYGSGTVNTEDYVFLLSEWEIFGKKVYDKTEHSYSTITTADGSQYEYMASQSNRVKTTSGTATNWYSRTVGVYSGNYCGIGVSATGDYSLYSRNYTKCGICPAFCL